MCHIAVQQSDHERIEFWAEIATFEPNMFVWLDETGFNRRNGLRKYGYGLRGLPPKDFTLKVGGHHYSHSENGMLYNAIHPYVYTCNPFVFQFLCIPSEYT